MTPLADFMAMTLVVLLALFIICGPMHASLIIATIGLLMGFYSALKMEMYMNKSRFESWTASEPNSTGLGPDPYGPADAFADDRVALFDTAGAPRPYPGAILLDAGSQWPDTAAGARDLRRGENAAAPRGNFYNFGRTAAPETAGPCTDGEANAEEIDGDEANTYQVRSRNDPVRITAGTMGRQRDMDRYLREEVLEAEEREWWGRHEI